MNADGDIGDLESYLPSTNDSSKRNSKNSALDRDDGCSGLIRVRACVCLLLCFAYLGVRVCLCA